jgi:hypothetical protein
MISNPQNLPEVTQFQVTIERHLVGHVIAVPYSFLIPYQQFCRLEDSGSLTIYTKRSHSFQDSRRVATSVVASGQHFLHEFYDQDSVIPLFTVNVGPLWDASGDSCGKTYIHRKDAKSMPLTVYCDLQIGDKFVYEGDSGHLTIYTKSRDGYYSHDSRGRQILHEVHEAGSGSYLWEGSTVGLFLADRGGIINHCIDD